MLVYFPYRQVALEIEKLRAAEVAALPPPPPDPIQTIEAPKGKDAIHYIKDLFNKKNFAI